MPGGSYFSWETPHYHRRYGVFTSEFGMGSGGTATPLPPGKFCFYQTASAFWFNLYQAEIFLSNPPKHLRRCMVKPHGSLVPVSSTHRCAYTPGLSTSSSSAFPSGPPKGQGETHLGASFVLRCFQHLSLPHLATGQCHWHDNPNTSDASTRSSRTRSSPPVLQRPRQIRDRNCLDVLNQLAYHFKCIDSHTLGTNQPQDR